MVSNLLDNAIRHTAPPGKVALAVSTNAASFHVIVKDSGEGISERDLPRVFERFFRGGGARSRTGSGFGLGLSIVKHVVDENGGSVEVESREGAGTTVQVRWPLGRSSDANTG